MRRFRAITHWFATRHQTTIDARALVYGPSVIYMASELIRQWSDEGEGVVVHTPAYDAFIKRLKATIASSPRPAGERRQRPVLRYGKTGGGVGASGKQNPAAVQSAESTGKVWTRDELETMSALCERHGVRVISDEIHMDMVWGNQPHIPWSNVARGDWALLSSGSKSFNIPALTGAYGIIENSESRERYLTALKVVTASPRQRCSRSRRILPRISTARRGWMRYASIWRLICAISSRR